MIFAIQRFLEDNFERRHFDDPDQYAVKLANLYGQRRWHVDRDGFRRSMARIRTAFFRSNLLRRPDVELDLLVSLDRKFLKKNPGSPVETFPGGTEQESRRLQREPRVVVADILGDFSTAVEGRCIDDFWVSRTKRKLISQPERRGQNLLAMFLTGVLRGRRGTVVRELSSGIGWVDIALFISATPHLIEMKVTQGEGLIGVEQLGEYMSRERKQTGWLVIFDARPQDGRAPIPGQVLLAQGRVRVLTVDINPPVPSRIKRR